MKKILLPLFVIFLASCAGGSSNGGGGNGGGGGGGGGNRPGGGSDGGSYPTFPTEPLEYDNVLDLFSSGQQVGDVLVSLGIGGRTITITDNNTITFTTNNPSPSDELFFNTSRELDISRFNKLLGPGNTGFYIGSNSHEITGLTQTSWLANIWLENGSLVTPRFDLTGKTAVIEDTLILGGKALGLQHTEFGIWNMSRRIEGHLVSTTTNYNQNGYFDNDTRVFTLSSSPKTAFAQGMTGMATFKGAAVAVASNGLQGSDALKTQTVYGFATLTLDTSKTGYNIPANILVLDFPDFYKFTIEQVTNLNTGQVGDGYINSVENNGNKTGINFDGAPLGSWYVNMSGGLYGVSGNPSEVSGTFYISRSDIRAFITGAFGAKR